VGAVADQHQQVIKYIHTIWASWSADEMLVMEKIATVLLDLEEYYT